MYFVQFIEQLQVKVIAGNFLYFDMLPVARSTADAYAVWKQYVTGNQSLFENRVVEGGDEGMGVKAVDHTRSAIVVLKKGMTCNFCS